MTIISKDISPYSYGDTIKITYNGTGDTVPDLTTVVDHNGDNPLTIEFDEIMTVINTSGSPVTVYGHTFQSGTTVHKTVGGLPIDPPLQAGDALEGGANVTISLYGQITWGPDHSEKKGT